MSRATVDADTARSRRKSDRAQGKCRPWSCTKRHADKGSDGSRRVALDRRIEPWNSIDRSRSAIEMSRKDSSARSSPYITADEPGEEKENAENFKLIEDEERPVPILKMRPGLMSEMPVGRRMSREIDEKEKEQGDRSVDDFP